MPGTPLSDASLREGVAFLSSVDTHLAAIADRLGTPPLWARQPGFATLLRIILEQQVSLASAGAAYAKLQQALGDVTPQSFVTLADAELKQIGFSRQKTAYCRGLAFSILNHEIDLHALRSLSDSEVRTELVKLKGVGPWTADIYLLMALLRPDSWPAGDLALAAALQELKDLPARPDAEEMERLSLPWRPWRAVAARLLWHFYLSKPKMHL